MITIYGCEYYADLFVLPLRGIDEILGMNWLTNHGAMINYEEKSVSIRNPDGGRIKYYGDQYLETGRGYQSNSLKK